MYGLLVLVALFFVLSPGVLLTLPRVGKNMWMSRQTSLMAAAVHAVVFGLVVYFLYVYSPYQEGFQSDREMLEMDMKNMQMNQQMQAETEARMRAVQMAQDEAAAKAAQALAANQAAMEAAKRAQDEAAAKAAQALAANQAATEAAKRAQAEAAAKVGPNTASKKSKKSTKKTLLSLR